MQSVSHFKQKHLKRNGTQATKAPDGLKTGESSNWSVMNIYEDESLEGELEEAKTCGMTAEKKRWL